MGFQHWGKKQFFSKIDKKEAYFDQFLAPRGRINFAKKWTKIEKQFFQNENWEFKIFICGGKKSEIFTKFMQESLLVNRAIIVSDFSTGGRKNSKILAN